MSINGTDIMLRYNKNITVSFASAEHEQLKIDIRARYDDHYAQEVILIPMVANIRELFNQINSGAHCAARKLGMHIANKVLEPYEL